MARQGTKLTDWFERRIVEEQDSPDFELELVLLDLEEQIREAMESQGASRSALAERLGTSRAFVTKLLSGHENLTLKTLVRVANALEMKTHIQLQSRTRSRQRGGVTSRTSTKQAGKAAGTAPTRSAAARSRHARGGTVASTRAPRGGK